MSKWVGLALLILAAILGPASARPPFLLRGNGGPLSSITPPTLGPTTLSPGTFQAVGGDANSNIGSLSTASTGPSNPSYSFQSSGSVCNTTNGADNGKFALSGTSLNVGASDVLAAPGGTTYSICIRDTQLGGANSPFDQALTIASTTTVGAFGYNSPNTNTNQLFRSATATTGWSQFAMTANNGPCSLGSNMVGLEVFTDQHNRATLVNGAYWAIAADFVNVTNFNSYHYALFNTTDPNLQTLTCVQTIDTTSVVGNGEGDSWAPKMYMDDAGGMHILASLCNGGPTQNGACFSGPFHIYEAHPTTQGRPDLAWSGWTQIPLASGTAGTIDARIVRDGTTTRYIFARDPTNSDIRVYTSTSDFSNYSLLHSLASELGTGIETPGAFNIGGQWYIYAWFYPNNSLYPNLGGAAGGAQGYATVPSLSSTTFSSVTVMQPSDRYGTNPNYPEGLFFIPNGASSVAQAIADVTQFTSSTTFQANTGDATVGTVHVTMDPSTPAFSGSLSVTGANSCGFHLVGSVIQSSEAGCSATGGPHSNGLYDDWNLVATQPGIVGSPFTRAEAATASVAAQPTISFGTNPASVFDNTGAGTQETTLTVNMPDGSIYQGTPTGVCREQSPCPWQICGSTGSWGVCAAATLNSSYDVTSDHFDVTAPISGGPNIVQAITDHGTPTSTHGNGTQKCVWPFTQVQDFRGVTGTTIQAGHYVVGYVHSANNGDNTPMYPQSVTDDAGHNYALSPGVLWQPYPEDIGIFYLPNLSANATTLTFDYTQYPNSGNTVLDFCDVGFVEYSGVTGINTVVNPFDAGAAQNPSLTISPTSKSVIFTLGATNTASDGSDLLTSGYGIIVAGEQSHDGIGIWGSNGPVNAGANTLTWFNSYYNASTCSDGSPAGTSGCTTVLSAVALTTP